MSLFVAQMRCVNREVTGALWPMKRMGALKPARPSQCGAPASIDREDERVIGCQKTKSARGWGCV